MAIRRLQTCIVIITCAIAFPCVLSKPFSLNKAIAAEKAARESAKRSHAVDFDIQKKDLNEPKISDTIPEDVLFSTVGSTAPLTTITYEHNKSKKFKKATEFLSPKKIISPLKYRKLFQIKIPLKPKPLRLQRPRLFKKKDQLLQSETSKNEKLNDKYIPLLRNIGLLFDNILRDSDSEAHESKEVDNGASDDVAGDKDDIVCACPLKSESQPGKEAATDPSAPCAAVEVGREDHAKASASPTHHTTPRNFSRLRQNKNIPLLPTRDTASSGRNDHGISQGSGPTLHGSTEGNITRDNGDSQHHTRGEGNATNAAIHEEITDGTPRDSASSNRSDRGFGGDRVRARSPDDWFGINATKEAAETEDATGETGADVFGHKIEDKLSDRGNETEHTEFLRGRAGGVVPEYQVGDTAEPVQPQENYAQSVVRLTKHLTSDKRFAQGNGAFATEDKELRTKDEAVISRDIPKTMRDPKTSKVVMIIDGYSVTRGKFGENKLTEKSIQIS